MYVLGSSSKAEQVWLIGHRAKPSRVLNDIKMEGTMMTKFSVINLKRLLPCLLFRLISYDRLLENTQTLVNRDRKRQIDRVQLFH